MQDPISDKGFSGKKTRQFFILAFIIITGILLFSELMFLMSAFLGAIALYVILRVPHKVLRRRYKLKKGTTTLLLIICSIIVLLLPFYFTIRFVAAKVNPYLANPEPLIDGIKTINNYISNRFNFTLLTNEHLEKVPGLLAQVLTSVIGSGLLLLTEIIMLYFILWFMLNNSFRMERWLRFNSPFNRTNTNLLFNETKSTIVNNAIGIFIMGLIQGIVAIIGYSIFGVPEPVLWGLITAVASVVPFAGTMLVWVPATILLFATGHNMPGVGLSLWGFFLIGGIDNIARFMLQKKLAQTHPLITVLGVIAGLSLFGFWGLIFGPFLFTLFIMLCRIYRREYIESA